MNRVYHVSNERNEKIPPPKKFDFKCKKEATVKSLFEVEHFLCHMDQLFNYIKLYHILK